MFYFFYGEDSYSLKKKLLEFRERFSKADPSLMNLTEIAGEKLNWQEYSNIVNALPFLAEKRLIIIKNLLLENKDDDFKKKVASSINKIPETSVVVFAEQGLPDARTTLFKALNKPRASFRFNIVSPQKLSNFMDEKIRQADCSISSDAKKKLQLFVGPDLWRLEQETAKLCFFAKANGRKEIFPDDIEEMIKAENSSSIFELTDAIIEGNLKKAFIALSQIKNAGEDEFYIFTMVVYQFRNLLSIFDLASRGMSNQEIAKEAKIHPFVVSKNKSLLKRYSANKLRAIYLTLYETDCKIKAGSISASLALDLMMAKVTKNDFAAE